jgi:hypothetical protein
MIVVSFAPLMSLTAHSLTISTGLAGSSSRRGTSWHHGSVAMAAMYCNNAAAQAAVFAVKPGFAATTKRPPQRLGELLT